MSLDVQRGIGMTSEPLPGALGGQIGRAHV